MKVADLVGDVEGLKIFKPIQYIHVKGVCGAPRTSSVRVRLVNTENGRTEEIIPMMTLEALAEITAMNEGFFYCQQQQDRYHSVAINIMLHPSMAVYLSNDKYLEVDVIGFTSGSVYGLECENVDKDFLCRYNKFFMAAGELQKNFSIGKNENLILPKDTFEEVTLHFKNGSTCTYTQVELAAKMMLKNDIVRLCDLTPSPYVAESFVESIKFYSNAFGYDNYYGLDVSEVESISLRRNYATTGFEFYMLDVLAE
jgi:hypothetical protein